MPNAVVGRSWTLRQQFRDRCGVNHPMKGTDWDWVFEKLAALELENERLSAEVKKAGKPQVYGGARR